jgi:hypothetical protein
MPELGVFAPLPDLWQIHREYEAMVTPFINFVQDYVSGLIALAHLRFNGNLTSPFLG